MIEKIFEQISGLKEIRVERADIKEKQTGKQERCFCVEIVSLFVSYVYFRSESLFAKTFLENHLLLAYCGFRKYKNNAKPQRKIVRKA